MATGTESGGGGGLRGIAAGTAQLETVGVGRRTGAWAIDHLILAPTAMLLTVAYFEYIDFLAIPEERVRFGVILFYGLGILYNVLATMAFGATVGKEILGLKVVSSDGGPIGFLSVLKREVVGKFLCQLTLLYGFWMITKDRRHRGLHDRISGALVVRRAGKVHQVTGDNSDKD